MMPAVLVSVFYIPAMIIAYSLDYGQAKPVAAFALSGVVEAVEYESGWQGRLGGRV